MNKKKDKYNVESNMTDFTAVSATDCTGLIPSEPKNKELLESYEEIYPCNIVDKNSDKKLSGNNL